VWVGTWRLQPAGGKPSQSALPTGTRDSFRGWRRFM